MSTPVAADASRQRPLPPGERLGPITPALLAAARGRPAEHTPVWFMRQAGRSLPEYRALRRQLSMFDVIRRPEVAAEVTLQPTRRYAVDAAILFSDITTPLEAAGVAVELREGVGPVFANPIRSARDIASLRVPSDDDLAHVTETARLVIKDLKVPLIGFAGAPFTLASYLIEGSPSKDHARTKALMLSEPTTWAALMDRLADVSIAFLSAQIEAGAAAVQLFDSWVGALSPVTYQRCVQPASAKVIRAARALDVPVIHFGVGTGELLELMAETGADVVGVDWRTPLDRARDRLGGRAVQGNLDPAVCLAPWAVVEREVEAVLAANGNRPGHIFNLGHGVLPATDPGVLGAVVDFVHARTEQA